MIYWSSFKKYGLIPILCLIVTKSLICHIEPSQVGIARNLFTGNMWLMKSGYSITWPWIMIAEVDARPVRVSVESAGHGYSAKLVRFVPEYWREFVNTEGFRYYWWSNRLSFNSSYSEENRGMKDILRGYAYSRIKYPFYEVLKEF